MTEPENHALAVLREMRAEQHAVRQDIQQRLERVEKRLDAIHLSGVGALEGVVGHRAMAERIMGSFEVDVTDLGPRVALETARA